MKTQRYSFYLLSSPYLLSKKYFLDTTKHRTPQIREIPEKQESDRQKSHSFYSPQSHPYSKLFSFAIDNYQLLISINNIVIYMYELEETFRSRQ